jgi:hypothetical protein
LLQVISARYLPKECKEGASEASEQDQALRTNTSKVVDEVMAYSDIEVVGTKENQEPIPGSRDQKTYLVMTYHIKIRCQFKKKAAKLRRKHFQNSNSNCKYFIQGVSEMREILLPNKNPAEGLLTAAEGLFARTLLEHFQNPDTLLTTPVSEGEVIS